MEKAAASSSRRGGPHPPRFPTSRCPNPWLFVAGGDKQGGGGGSIDLLQRKPQKKFRELLLDTRKRMEETGELGTHEVRREWTKMAAEQWSFGELSGQPGGWNRTWMGGEMERGRRATYSHKYGREITALIAGLKEIASSPARARSLG